MKTFSQFAACVLFALLVFHLTEDSSGTRLSHSTRPSHNRVSSEKALNDYLKNTVEKLKEILPNGDKNLNIPPLDPFRPKNVISNIKNKKIQLRLKLSNLKVNGTSNFKLRDINTDIRNSALSTRIIIPFIKVTGTYEINGRTMKFIPIHGKGKAMINVKNFKIDVQSRLKIDKNTGRLRIKYYKIKLTTDEIVVKLKNVQGGDSLRKLINKTISKLAKPIFDKKKPDIEKTIKKVIPPLIEKQLKNVDIRQIIKHAMSFNHTSNTDEINAYVDQQVNNFLNDDSLQINPLIVPPQRTNESGMEVQFNNGRVYGLKTLHRSGDINLSCDNVSNVCQMSGVLAINSVSGTFNTSLRFSVNKLYPSLKITVKEICVAFKILLDTQSKKMAQLIRFEIVTFDKPKLYVGNFGFFSPIATRVLNRLVPLVKGKITDAIEKPVKKVLQDELENVEFDI